jgi:hypothetical protein
MRNLEIVQRIRREIRSALRLAPWLLATVFVTALLWRVDLSATSGLFQSASPVTPTVEAPPPTSTPTEVPTATALPPTPTAVETETPSTTATLTATTTLTTTSVPTATLPPTVVPATVQPTASPTASTTPSPTPLPTADERYAEGESNLKFDWSMLFDSVALGASYIWLCCGVLVVISIPVGFAVLWAAGRRTHPGAQGQEESEEPAEDTEEEEEE